MSDVKRGPRICIMSSGRKPNDERIYYKIGRSLRKRYDDVVVIAPGDCDHRFDDGIVFVATPKRRSRWNRIGTLRALYRTAKEQQAAVYQCEEIDSWLVGWLVARKTGAKLVFDAHEFDPAGVSAGAPPVVRSVLWLIVALLQRFLARRTSLILVANDIVRGYFLILDRFARVVLLENAPVLALFSEGVPGPKDGVLLCHEGSLGFARGLKSMVRLVERLVKSGVNVRLRIVGDVFGEERIWLEEELRRSGMTDRIERTGWLKYPDVGKAVEGCDIGLIAMQPTPLNMQAGRPNKLFNYMRYGLAVVSADFPEIARVLREEQCGITYACGDDDALVSATTKLVEDEEFRRTLGANGRRAALSKYNWEHAEAALLEAYAEITAAPAGRMFGSN